MGQALAVADLVLGRGGANTFSELAALGKPALIVPHPGLDDQMLNATTLSRAGAIKVLPQDRLTKQSLISQLEQILDSETEQSALSKAITEFAVADADVKLAKVILEVAQDQTKTEHRSQELSLDDSSEVEKGASEASEEGEADGAA